MRGLLLILVGSWLLAAGSLQSSVLSQQSTVYSPQSTVLSPQSATLSLHLAVGGYDSLWRQVDSLANAGLPNSALAVVDQIYNQARENQDNPELIKAIINRISLNSSFRENPLQVAIRDIQGELIISHKPVTQILRSILGELYYSYYQNNQYRFADRSFIAVGQSDDPETWDAKRLLYEIILNYRQSLDDESDLQEIPLESYRAILEYPILDSGKKDTIPGEHSTLFDFLAQRAIQFFTQTGLSVSQSVNTFTPGIRDFFAPTSDFINYPLKPSGLHARPGDGTFIPPGNDTLSLAWYAIRIFQVADQFHIDDKDPDALIGWELQRFSYVLNESGLPDKDSIYIEALRAFENNYSFSPASTGISFALAQALMEGGGKFDPLVSDVHRWELKEAFQVCKRAVERIPESIGGKNCQSLISQILAPALQVTAEYAIIPDQPALASVSFKNISSLYFRLVKTDQEKFQSAISGSRQEDIFNYLVSLEAVDHWRVNLPLAGDFQEHRTEFMIPPVQAGFYLLVASADSLFQDPSEPFGYQTFWSTSISYVTQRNEKGGVDIYLLDRQTGFPMKNLFIEAFSRSYDARSRTYVTVRAGEYHSDESGFFTVPAPQGKGSYSNLILFIHDNKDLLVTQPLYVYPVSDRSARPSEQTRFFTDRAIYRPGQTIYFKGIMLDRSGDSTSLKPGVKTLVTFTDVNGQKITDQAFVTNEYGSFNGTFTAPTSVLTGEMRIYNESGSVTISVEEYKRPTFEILINPVEGNYKLGEKVSIAGKATGYAGNAIDEASVSYRVIRTATYPFRDSWWRIPFPQSPEVEITNGTTMTSEDGSFSIVFEALPDASLPLSAEPVFNFRVIADVTDRNGETRSTEATIPVGFTSLLINFSIPEKVNLKTEGKFDLTTTNLNGKPTPAMVQVTLQKLSVPERAFRSRLWNQCDTMIISRNEFYTSFPHDIYSDDDNPDTWPVEGTVFSQVMNTQKDSVLVLLDTGYGIWDEKRINPGSHIPDPGSYKLILSANDPFGQKVEKVLFFTAFDPDSKKVPVPEFNWFVPLVTSGEPGDTASFLIGTSDKEIRVIREVRLKDQLFSREWLILKNQQKIIEVPILESFRGNFSVNFLFVCENRVFQNNQVVSVPYTNKTLDINFETFRNKLIPGQQEEWKIRISDASGKGVTASLLATMYDRSLDIFRSNSWAFDLFKTYYYGNPWDVSDDFRTSGGSWYVPWADVSDFQYRKDIQLNWFGLQPKGYGYFLNAGRKGGRQLMMNKDSYAMDAAPGIAGQQETPPPSMDDPGMLTGILHNQDVSPVYQHITVIPVRKDFRETAFFYPSLITDSSGNVSLNFTVPEALTSWKILGLAYTRNLDYGLVEKEAVTQKELMVFPNAPRFVRQGDTVVFTARIVNLSEHELTGMVRLDLVEGITMQPLNSLILDPGYGIGDTGSVNRKSRTGAKRSSVEPIPDPGSFTIPVGQSTSVSWVLAIPVSTSISLLQYTISAQAGNVRDGEMNTIPVLSNRLLVTESLPLPVRGKGVFDFKFDKLLNSSVHKSLNNYRLTLEFASNPAWYAVQALPVLDETSYRNADQIFGAFYSNAIASHIAIFNPRVRLVFESWKALMPNALLSNLEKNEELKSAVLAETPWVMDAKKETDARRKLGLYFDMNTLQQHYRENLKLLQQMQYPSGGWPWFEGMRENRIVTLTLLTGFGRLEHMGIRYTELSTEVTKMVQRAIAYLDQEIINDFITLQKTFPGKLGENHLTPFQVKYLYARSLFTRITDAGVTPPQEGSGVSGISESLEYYTGQAKKFWLKQDLYSQGLIALALYRMGDRETPGKIMKSLSERALHSPEMGMYWATGGGYEWYQAPVETQALMIEAFDEVTNDQNSVEELKIWLLKQKQTRQWRTRQASVDACYALLMKGTDLLSEDQQIRIRLGNTEIDPSLMPDLKMEAGTGYFSMFWSGDAIRPDMGNITVTKSTDGIAWGGFYWQYFENLDQITPHQTPLTVEKQIFLERNTDAGPVLLPITNSDVRFTNDSSSHNLTISPFFHLVIGDKLKVRLIVTVDRNMEFVHLKDMRAAGLEPAPTPQPPPQQMRGSAVEGLSGYRYQDGLGYYQSTTDLATNFFFDYLPKGTWVFEYPLVANNAGDFSAGIATIQCMYAPEFSAHSGGERLEVEK